MRDKVHAGACATQVANDPAGGNDERRDQTAGTLAGATVRVAADRSRDATPSLRWLGCARAPWVWVRRQRASRPGPAVPTDSNAAATCPCRALLPASDLSE